MDPSANSYPEWLQLLAWISLVTCFLCALWIVIDEGRRPQKMWIMNLMWPMSALYSGPFAVWLYRRTLPHMAQRNRNQKHVKSRANSDRSRTAPHNSPDGIQIAVAVSHCGAGCTLGDIIGETMVPALGLVFAGEFASKLIVDFLLAYGLGIAFQYFTKAPMRGLSLRESREAAIRADTISIGLFEVGMFAWIGFQLLCSVSSAPSEADRGPLLVHDANRYAGGIRHVLSGQRLAHQEGMERRNSPL